MKNLNIRFCGIECENPFFLASSVVASNYDMCARALDMGWGGIVFKTLAPFVSDDVSPRFDTLEKGSGCFTGFRNLEMLTEKTLEENLECLYKLKKNYPDKVLIASVMGEKEEEWEMLAREATLTGADIIECNFSCPQMTKDTLGAVVGQNPELVRSFCRATIRGTNLPVLAKMTPNLTDMVPLALAAVEGGATGIAAINTIKSITGIDLHTMRGLPVIKNKTAVSGYSGKAVKPIALRFIYDIMSREEFRNMPVSGIGGIETWKDALEFIGLGVRNVQIATAVMQFGYRIIDDLKSGTLHYLEKHNYENLDAVVGRALPSFTTPEKLDRSWRNIPYVDYERCIGCGRCYISCNDGGHQAIEWNRRERMPRITSSCVGCHLCKLVCPVSAIEENKKL